MDPGTGRARRGLMVAVHDCQYPCLRCGSVEAKVNKTSTREAAGSPRIADLRPWRRGVRTQTVTPESADERNGDR